MFRKKGEIWHSTRPFLLPLLPEYGFEHRISVMEREAILVSDEVFVAIEHADLHRVFIEPSGFFEVRNKRDWVDKFCDFTDSF